MSGYNFDRLYKYAEILAEKVQTNRRVTDVGIELGNSDYWQMQDEAASELYIKYDMEKGEGKELAQKWNISAFPTYLILNPQGEVVYTSRGCRHLS